MVATAFQGMDTVVGHFVHVRSRGQFAVQIVGEHAMALFGTHVVVETQQTFTLAPVSALDPALIGTEVVRHIHPGHDAVAVFSNPVQVTSWQGHAS